MQGPGTLPNIICAFASFFIPGLGQLAQGRWWSALWQFSLSALLWLIWLGWLIQLWSVLDAALHRRDRDRYTVYPY